MPDNFSTVNEQMKRRMRKCKETCTLTIKYKKIQEQTQYGKERKTMVKMEIGLRKIKIAIATPYSIKEEQTKRGIIKT